MTTTVSPGRTFARPHEPATRLIDSVVPRVKTTASGAQALTNRATVFRASSYASVAATASPYAPRWTLALMVR